MHLRTLIFILFFSTQVLSKPCYSQTTESLLFVYFTEIRSGNYHVIPKYISLAENGQTTLKTITPYLNDTLPEVRAKAYTIVNLAGTNATSFESRENAVLKLAQAANDANSGNAGIALDYLTNFQRHDFNPAAQDSIRNLFRKRPFHMDKILKLAGFLEITDLAEEIRPLTQPGNPTTIRWAAILSLTRMGDEMAMRNMMTRVRKFPVNDDVVYQIFPDLIYSRSREAIGYMIEAMESDAKNCLSADAEREVPIPCGYRIMEQLAPVIRDYPLELDESGDIKSDDYLASLAEARYWFSQNKDFEILRDRY